MLPGNVPSTVAVPSEFLSPDDQVSSPLIDFERGGVALNNSSLGLNYQNWSCFVATNGLDWAASQSFFAKLHFFIILRLLEQERMAAVVVARC